MKIDTNYTQDKIIQRLFRRNAFFYILRYSNLCHSCYILGSKGDEIHFTINALSVILIMLLFSSV